MASLYRISEVDGDENSDVLQELHTICFGLTADQADYGHGHWWLAHYDKEPVAFAGIVPSALGFNTGYLKRAGVIPEHRGVGLQKRLIRVREARARKNGWSKIVTDCTDNPASANSLYASGFKMFKPRYGWAFDNSLYWYKTIH
jgi:GNAT superfamily N-acetyltransferase